MEILPALAALLAMAILGVAVSLKGELRQVRERLATQGQDQERLERAIREEAAGGRTEAALQARQSREELSGALRQLSESLQNRMAELATLQANQLGSLTQANELKLEKLRESVETRLKSLQEDNSLKLEQMRATVDEKLHATLEQRLGESFKLVSERLEQVHQGLGEMQALAAGVGDLKKVMTGVKTRGIWGEVQLAALLEQALAPDQYAGNVATRKGSAERVEFAVKLPGYDASQGQVWLPIDAKFPQEDYQRLLEAQEQANAALAEEAGRQLEQRIKSEAKDIREKYLDPPNTTDFGIMFLPTEGLYAEVLRRTGLSETLQREYRVVVTGPTTLLALLNSLQMGFRTLAIQKHSSEVWALLGAVKAEFTKFGDLLDKTQKKLVEATNTIDSAKQKTRTIERKLGKVQELPPDPRLAVPTLGGPLELSDDGDEDTA